MVALVEMSSQSPMLKAKAHVFGDSASSLNGEDPGVGKKLEQEDHAPCSSSQELTLGERACLTWQACTHGRPLRLVGAGSFGKVELAQLDLPNNRSVLYARKICNTVKTTQERFEAEVAALQAAQGCPFVPELYAAQQVDQQYIICMEYASCGTLLELVQHLHTTRTTPKSAVMPEEFAAYYGACIIVALRELHSKGMCHRDVKLENVLLSQSGRPQLADMGSADRADSNGRFLGVYGTVPYHAPEVRQGGDLFPYTNKVDVYSLGLVLLQLVVGELDLMGLKQIRMGKYQWPEHLSSQLQDLLKRRMLVPILQRASLDEVMQHDFFSSVGFDDLPSFCPPFSPAQLQEMAAVAASKMTDEERELDVLVQRMALNHP